MDSLGRKTGERIPDFTIPLLNGGAWSSREPTDTRFTLLTIYRGMWCAHCKHQLQELDSLVEEFESRGVSVLAASADTGTRGRKMADDYELNRLSLGYEVPIAAMRKMGVFISSQVKEIEMPLFCEPASLLIDGDSNLFAAWIASCAFARTSQAEILTYIDFISEQRGRPPRGSA